VRGRIHRQSACNRLQYAFHVTQNFIIPKSYNAIVVLLQPLIAHSILRIIGVLATVNFNNESEFATNKVDNIRSDRLLANKFMSVD
jgi:hypothetical protein